MISKMSSCFYMLGSTQGISKFVSRKRNVEGAFT